MADFDPYSREYFLSCCAYEVYNQYQRNLFEEYTPQPTPYACTSEVQQAYHFHVVGDIGEPDIIRYVPFHALYFYCPLCIPPASFF